MAPRQDEPNNRDIMARIDQLDQRFERVESFITGDRDPERGVIVRLDRIEQNHENRKWWTQTAVGAGLASIIGSAWAIFSNK